MHRMIHVIFASLVSLYIIGCTSENTTENRQNDASYQGAGDLPPTVSIAGSLAIGANVAGTVVPSDTGTFLADQAVEMRSLSGDVIASGKTSSAGAFTIAIDTTSMGLTLMQGPSNNDSMVVELVGIVKRDHDDKVQGVKRTVVINSQSLTPSPDGSGALDLGTNTTKGIGAIRGKVTLEGGASPVGADIYVPGTSFTAKADDTGEFTLAFLNPGTYDIRVEKDGYGAFVFPQVKVNKNDTTALTDIQLSVSQGPIIESFTTFDGKPWVRTPELKVRFATKNAVKFKLSQWSDFRYAVYTAIDLTKMPQEPSYVITGGDGPVTLYLRVADADGFEVDSSLTIRLDSTLPISPIVEVVASGSLSAGYSNTRDIALKVEHCHDTAKIYIKDSAAPSPNADDFTIDCSTTTNISYLLGDFDGVHSLYVWAMDATDQISLAPATIAINLDRSAPTLTVLPAAGAYNTSINVTGTLNENGAVFYSIDGSNPTQASSRLETNLILIGNTTLKLIGYDLAGNPSPIVTRSYIIDTDAPILGSISIPGGKTVTNNQTISLDINAINADYFMLAESPTFTGGTWQPYTSSPSYTFATSVNEIKTIYVKFRDEAGNQLGQNGDLFDRITYDSVIPEHLGITLFYPETPSGSFDKILLWQNSTSESGTHYQIEVHSNDSYNDLIRSGSSLTTSWKVTPAFTSPGIYYWRVRVVDDAGNVSPWVEGGTEKLFEIKLFGKTYVSTERISAPGASSGYGVNVVKRSGANNLYLVSSVKDPETACSNCSSVQLIDWETKNVVHTFASGSSERDAFGAVVSQCDLTNDGVDEIVIAAPLKPYQKEVGDLQRTYSNAGAVYVYDGVSHSLLFMYTIEPNYPENNCNERYQSGECKTYGWQDWYGNDFQNYLWINANRQLTGLGLTCQREAGPDTLAVASPGWSNVDNKSVGRVEFVNYSATSPYFTVSASALSGTPHANEYQSDQFGRSIQYLSKLKITGHDGPAIVVGAPGRASGGHSRGAALIYDTSLTLLATIVGGADYQNYGSLVVNLGNLDQDVGGYEEFSVSGSGVVRIYNGNTSDASPAVLKSIKRIGNDNSSFGRAVAAVGDITGDGFSEIAVADPTRQISGNWGAGIVYIYDYAALDDVDATQVEESALYVIAGPIAGNTYTGQNILQGEDTDNNGTIDTIRLSTSGISGGRGAIHTFSLVSMAPTLPSSIDGSTTGATFGYRVISIPDIDGDGTNDFAVSSPNVNFVYQGVGRVDFISGSNNGILKTIYGRQQNQKLGTDLLFVDNIIFVLDQQGMMLRFDKNDILFVNDINDYQTGSWNYRYSRRNIGSSSTDRVGIVQEPMNVGKAYAVDDWEKMIGLHSTGQGWYGGSTRYGSLGVYTRYFSGQRSFSECGSDNECKCVIYGPLSNEEFGYSATFISDINGDSVVDIAVGAPAKDNGDGTKGVVYVFDGNLCVNKAILTVSDALYEITPASLVGGSATTRFGANLLPLTDLDDSGPMNGSLVITNTHWYDTSSTTVAELFIASHTDKKASLVHGSVTFKSMSPNPTDGNNVSITMTKSVVAGDVWGTTCSAAGNAISFTLGKLDSGEIYAYPYNIQEAVAGDSNCKSLIAVLNTPNQWSAVQELAATNLSGGSAGALSLQAHVEMPAGSLFGANILNIGDTNRDGYPELAIATPKAQGLSSATAGQVGIYSVKTLIDGSADQSFPKNAELIKFYSPTPGFANFGASISQSDINGDGIVDFLIGAPLYSSSSQSSVGTVYLYHVKGVDSE